MKISQSIMDPFTTFERWYRDESDLTNVIVPSACCLSTMGTDGFPNARFVALKEVKNERFIITGPMDSRKGEEIRKTPRAALTFWWPVTGIQVRIQGRVRLIDSAEADRYFSERSREAQIVSWVSQQGRPLLHAESMKERYDHLYGSYSGMEIPRPENWNGIAIDPVRIEFLVFSSERFHERILYQRDGDGWHVQSLQP
jgi:pyridoxamine 5'-phosphate oxidase